MKSGFLTKLLICLAILAVTLGVYWQVSGFHFTYTFDDDHYVTENRYVLSGLNAESMKWAFSSAGYASNWHPLTWISHMTDAQLFGVKNPGGHHRTSVYFHIASALLLFLLFERMTKSAWKSAFVAALFAIHPLHVESVAWISERKDVLSTFFMMLTLLAYVHYTKRPNVLRYACTMLLFALGLLAKPMLVTLPVLLLLIDRWPLARKATWGRLLAEKVPFFAMSVASACITVIAQRGGGAVAPFEVFPIGVRVANALVSYVAYLGKMFWPAKLGVFYPHLGTTLPVWQVVGSAVILVAITTFAVRLRDRFPALLVGWIWYVVTLVPVIGLVQVGGQAIADRYTYVPLIGIFAALAWTIPSLTAKRLHPAVFAVPAGLILVALTVMTYVQVGYWRTPAALFTHTLEVTDASRNDRAHMNLAVALSMEGKVNEAIEHYRETVRIYPRYVEAHNNLGQALIDKGDINGAIKELNVSLGYDPNSAPAHEHMGTALLAKDRVKEAVEHYRRAVELSPGYVRAHYSLAIALQRVGDTAGSIEHLTQAHELSPTDPIISNTLAWTLATCPDARYRNGEVAVQLAESASELTGNAEPSLLDTLAAAYAEAGRFGDAIRTAETALGLDVIRNYPNLAKSISDRLKLYRAGKAYHE